MKVALVLNGDEPGPDELKLLDACDAIVCADGAARSMLKTDHRPTVILGDLDSLDPDTYKWAEALDIPIEKHKPEKDETDGELALTKVLSMNPKSVLILGGHGGRTAMFLANLKLLRRIHDLGLEASMVGRGESVRYLSAGGEMPLVGRVGATLNVLALDAQAVVTLQGTAFAGADIELAQTSAKGVSNRITSDGAKLTVRKGTVLCVIERKKQEYFVL